jgi:hypothetical protein
MSQDLAVPIKATGEVVGHDSLIAPCRENGCGVDLQELDEVDCLIVLLW